jgi:hypothetical protein
LSTCRSRHVNLRLSEEEFQILVRDCLAARARSICDYARTMLCGQSISSAVSTQDIYLDLRRLSANLQAMEREMREFRARFASWQKSH